MLSSCHLVAFSATTDLERARAFYEDKLGLPVLDENPMACVFDANGTTLRVTLVGELAPAPYTVLGWTVDDIETMVSDLSSSGVVFERFDGMGQDGLGVWTAPGGARVAWFKDPDGSTLSITQLEAATASPARP